MLYKNIKIYDFNGETMKRYGKIRIGQDGDLFYSWKRLGIPIVLDKKQNHNHLQSKHLVGDLVVLEHIAFLTNVKDQEQEVEKNINEEVYPNLLNTKKFVYETKNVHTLEEERRCISEEKTFLSAEESVYNFQAPRKIADDFLQTDTKSDFLYTSIPQVLEVKLVDYKQDGFYFDIKGTPSRFFYKTGKGCLKECFYEDEWNSPTNYCRFAVSEEITYEKILSQKTYMKPKMNLYQYAKSQGYVEIDDDFGGGFNRAMRQISKNRDPEPEISPERRIYGDDYEEYLKNPENWEQVTDYEKDVEKKVIQQVKYKYLPTAYIRMEETLFNGILTDIKLLEVECNLDKINSAIREKYIKEELVVECD